MCESVFRFFLNRPGITGPELDAVLELAEGSAKPSFFLTTKINSLDKDDDKMERYAVKTLPTVFGFRTVF